MQRGDMRVCPFPLTMITGQVALRTTS